MTGLASSVSSHQSSLFAPPPADCAASPAGFLPKEHGSWSLALEPLALGLLVAPSRAGLALTVAALAGFFARRPLKAALAPDDTVRRRSARKIILLFSTLALAGLGEAWALGGMAALWPLLLAVPFGGLFVYFDAQNDSRAAAAELAGCAAFAFLPATFATLAGWPWPAALALSALALARSVPTVLTVRTCLRLNKRQTADALLPLAGGALALGLIWFLAAQHLAPGVAVGLAALLLVRSMLFVSSFRPVWPARRVGLFEAALGLLYVGAIALAYHRQ